MSRSEEANNARDRPIDENVTKKEGVRPPESEEDVHGYDNRTASPQGKEPIHPDRKDLKAPKEQREPS